MGRTIIMHAQRYPVNVKSSRIEIGVGIWLGFETRSKSVNKYLFYFPGQARVNIVMEEKAQGERLL